MQAHNVLVLISTQVMSKRMSWAMRVHVGVGWPLLLCSVVPGSTWLSRCSPGGGVVDRRGVWHCSVLLVLGRSLLVFGVECCVAPLGWSVRLCGDAEVASLGGCCVLALLCLVVVATLRCVWVMGMLDARGVVAPVVVSGAVSAGAAAGALIAP